MAEHRHLRRLHQVWIPHAVYFITVCTKERKSILTSTETADILRREWESAKDRHGWLVGRYVIMPDHVHFFCAENAEGAPHSLSQWMNKWKEWTAKGMGLTQAHSGPVWQRGFFDHLLRSNESYAEKWAYVRDNPVRAGLVKSRKDWPWQGFVDFDFPRGD
jgi:REP-associated tyrosine transposase